MLQALLTKAPIIAVLGAVIMFIIVASAGMGLEWPLLVALSSSLFAAAESWLLWLAVRQKNQTDKHLRHIRFIADRFQSLVRSAPCGYCLFTPQGLLREEQGVSVRLGVDKLSHLDDLIGAVKEGPELLEVFRKLQLSGDPFEFVVTSLMNEKTIPVVGRRFRVGKEGPHVDVLWFYDKGDLAQFRHDPVLMAALQVQIQDQAAQAQLSAKAAMKEASAEVAEVSAVVPAPIEDQDKQPKSAPQAAPPVAAPSVVTTTLACDALMNLFSFPVWGRGADYKILLCNEAYAKAVAVPVADVLSGQYEIVPASGKGGHALAEKAIKEGAAQSERDHAVVNGKRRLLEVTEIPVPAGSKASEAGVVLLGFALDVSGEEEQKTELRRHLAAHHEVLEHLGAAISVFGPDRRLEFYNRAYVQLWGAQESFLDDKPTFGEILEDLRSRRRIPEQADFQKYKKERKALFTSLLEPREDVMYLPDGTTLRILTAPHPLGGLMFVHENVTDQLALETDYNTLVAVQRETIDNLAEGIAVFGPDGKLRIFNNALAKLWGLSKDFLEKEPHVAELLEEARMLIDTTQDWAEHKSAMVSYALDRNPHAGQLDRTDQTVIEYLTVPLPDGSVLNSFLDVTDSVHVEQALRASNAALATADRLKSDFVANVSYQLRTPLNTITGFAEILVEQYFGKLNDRQLEYTTTIKAESEKLSHLINDVLDLATIEAGRMTLDRHEVSVSDLLNQAKQMTAEWARQQSLQILIECPSDIGSFEVDEHRMKQVLFNLISNAIQYTPAGGNIGLAAWRQEGWVILSVLDTGVGIPEADRERVFGKFEKANAHLRQGGAGLGLSLVKSFVELHGGRVEILSDEKDGTRISCFLPEAPEKYEGD